MDPKLPNLHAFCTGRVAYQQLSPADVASCEVNALDVFGYVIVGEPLQGPKEQVMQIHTDSYMAWKHTRNPDAAFETMRYFVDWTRENEIKMDSDRAMPSRLALESYELYDREPWRTLATNGREFGRARQIIPGHFRVEAAVSGWVEKAALGELTVEEALAGMDAEVDAIVADGVDIRVLAREFGNYPLNAR